MFFQIADCNEVDVDYWNSAYIAEFSVVLFILSGSRTLDNFNISSLSPNAVQTFIEKFCTRKGVFISSKKWIKNYIEEILPTVRKNLLKARLRARGVGEDEVMLVSLISMNDLAVFFDRSPAFKTFYSRFREKNEIE